MKGGEGRRYDRTDLRSKFRRLCKRAEKLGGFCALDVLDFLVVEETDGGAAPDYPCSIMLFSSNGTYHQPSSPLSYT